MFDTVLLAPLEYYFACYNGKNGLLLNVLNGKSTFLGRFPTKIDEIHSEDGPLEDLYTHQISSSLVGEQPRKVDFPFRTDIILTFRTLTAP